MVCALTPWLCVLALRPRSSSRRLCYSALILMLLCSHPSTGLQDDEYLYLVMDFAAGGECYHSDAVNDVSRSYLVGMLWTCSLLNLPHLSLSLNFHSRP